MRLAKPFFKLPVTFDVERLRAEAAAFAHDAWARHPNDIAGNSSLRLISVDGGENDEVNGIMHPTPHLLASPYMVQVLSSFGVVWSRSRLLKLSAQHGVPQHADINYHWFYRARLHVPILTHPEVRFHCDGESVHMAAGEAWIFDNWRQHRVDNPVNAPRIHLVADTAGTAAFWDLVGQSELPGVVTHAHKFDPARQPKLLTERTVLRPVMQPAEVDLLTLDLMDELIAPGDTPEHATRLARFRHMLQSFRRDWRQLYSLFGEAEAGWQEFIKLRDSVRSVAPSLGDGLLMRTNRVAAHTVLEARILRVALSAPKAQAAIQSSGTIRKRSSAFDRPTFIIAAPRSGSTLLFETLAASAGVCTVGGEAHWLVESIESLRLGTQGIDSNRLTAAQATDEVKLRMITMITDRLVDHSGGRVSPASGLAFVEKTPKNSLRIPFLNALFPDARFIFLWRDPRENLSSIMEAWRSGDWKTYNGLPGFDGPWSLLLPPGWERMNGRPLEEIAAFQWESANRIIMDDLEAIGPERRASLSYESLIADTRRTMERLCALLEIPLDSSLQQRLTNPLPLSRFTQTPPSAGKWKMNQQAIEQVLPMIVPTWKRLQSAR
jgi:hypothetical protein